MPTYEYVCKSCGKGWEEIQKISDSPVEVCPACGAPKAQRLISQGNFILKGSGWYVTGGYGSKESKASSSESSGVDHEKANSPVKPDSTSKAEDANSTSSSTTPTTAETSASA